MDVQRVVGIKTTIGREPVVWRSLSLHLIAIGAQSESFSAGYGILIKRECRENTYFRRPNSTKLYLNRNILIIFGRPKDEIMRKQLFFRFLFVSLSILLMFFLYVSYIKPGLILYYGYPEFFSDSFFFKKHLLYPGGITNYLSSFITITFNKPYLGSFLVFIVIIVIYLLFLFSLKARLKSSLGIYIIGLLPISLLIGLHCLYSHTIAVDLLVLFGLLFFIPVQVFYSGKTAISIFIFGLAFICQLFVAGIQGAIFLFLLYLALNLSGKINFKHLVMCLLISVGLILFSMYVYEIDKFKFYKSYLAFKERYVNLISFPILFCLSFPFILLFKQKNWFTTSYGKITSIKNITLFCILGLLTISSISYGFDKNTKVRLEIERYNHLNNWEMVLEKANEFDGMDRNVNFCVNRALISTGKFEDDFFKYDQRFGIDGLMLTEIYDKTSLIHNQELCYDIGALGLSIRWGFESLSFSGLTAPVMKNFVISYIAARRFSSAEKYLGLLKNVPFCNDWVENYEPFIKDTNLVYHDSRFKVIIEIAPSEDFLDNNYLELTNLYLVMKNNKNSYAYHYLFIGYLLNHKLNRFINDMAFLNPNNKKMKLPRLYSEAIVAYINNTGEIDPSFQNYIPNDKVMSDFRNFKQILAKHDMNKDLAYSDLTENYKNTYWYYLLYLSPRVTNLQLKNNESVNVFYNKK
jgi:hypothetical protein